jgi:tetratricopeptide (TPR) repeat protein
MGKRKEEKDPGSSRSGLRQTDSSNRRTGFRGYGHEILLLLFLGGLVFLIYSTSLNGPFVFDDIANIKDNPHIRLTELSLEGLMRAGFESRSSRRPVANMSFALNYYFDRYNVLGYHLVNVLIHIITGMLLYLFTKTTLSVPSQRPRYELYRWIPLAAALIWLVHPIQTQSVSYAKARLSGGKWAKWTLFAGCIVSGILALGSKQIAATLPFFILLYEWYFFQDLGKDWLRRHVKYFLGMFILTGLVAVIYLGANPLKRIIILRDFANNEFTFTERIFTQFRVVIHYISLLIFPHPSRLNLDHDFPLSHSLIDPITTLGSMLAISGLIGFAIYLVKRERLLSFCILWFFGNLVMESSVIPLAIIFEHRVYLPSMLVILMAVILGYRFMRWKWLRVAMVCALVVVFSFWTHQRNRVWSDEVTLWEDCVAKSPTKARAHNNLGVALVRGRKLEQAIRHYNEALRSKPDYADAHSNLGHALVRQGNTKQAIEHYLKALEIEPNFANAHINLASALQMQENLEQAIHHYSLALRLKPHSAEAHNGLGTILDKQGRAKEAIYHYSVALRLNPDYADAHNNLGVALEKQGRVDEAVSHYSAALHLKPDYAEAHNNLGSVLEKKGRITEAINHYRAAVRAEPDSAKSYNKLGAALEREGKAEEAMRHYSEALRIKPDYAKAHYNLGSVLLRKQRFEEAISHLYEALKIEPGYWQAHFNLGVALSRQGKPEEATFHFSEVLRIKPDEIRARRALELLSK